MKYWAVEIERTRVARERCIVRAETAEDAKRCAQTDDSDVIHTEGLGEPRETARALGCEESPPELGRKAAVGALAAQFPLDQRCKVKEIAAPERFALVQAFGSKHWIDTFPTPAASAAYCSTDRSGFEAIHLIDLDTGEPMSMGKGRMV